MECGWESLRSGVITPHELLQLIVTKAWVVQAACKRMVNINADACSF